LAYLASFSGDEELSSQIYSSADAWEGAADMVFASLND
jgi:hypothetical protein